MAPNAMQTQIKMRTDGFLDMDLRLKAPTVLIASRSRESGNPVICFFLSNLFLRE